jgi:murein DD-endopeptidase MepM/ murein hydrolase activator NlpD
MPVGIVRYNYSQEMKRYLKWRFVLIIAIYALVDLFLNVSYKPHSVNMPFKSYAKISSDRNSYWHSSWGNSVVHKGIDYFSVCREMIICPFNGWIVNSGYSERGGNFVYILGPKMRVYYFAHLKYPAAKSSGFVKENEIIGYIGNSGNAISKPCHLHLSIFSLAPIFGNYKKGQTMGWMRLFYLNPGELLKLNLDVKTEEF